MTPRSGPFLESGSRVLAVRNSYAAIYAGSNQGNLLGVSVFKAE